MKLVGASCRSTTPKHMLQVASAHLSLFKTCIRSESQWRRRTGGGGSGSVEKEAVLAGMWRHDPNPAGVRGQRESEWDSRGRERGG